MPVKPIVMPIKPILEPYQTIREREWISIDERLPETVGFYLCWREGFVPGKHLPESVLYDGIWTSMTQTNIQDVTHWMPLPQPPAEDD